MGKAGRVLTSIALGIVLMANVTACGKDAEEATPDQASVETSAEIETPTTADKPLPDEQLYVDVIAIGLDHTYGLTPDDGTLEVWQNLEGYGVMRWTDAEGREILVTRRYVEGEPTEWVYADEAASGDGVTDVSPTGAQLQAYDALAKDILAATIGATDAPTRVYAWTSASGIGSATYATDGVTDDPNLTLYFGEDEGLGRFDLTVR